MKTTRYLFAMSAVVCCVLAVSVVTAEIVNRQTTASEGFVFYALEGLEGIRPRVEFGISAFAEDKVRRDPLRIEDLQGRAEVVLRDAGVAVYESAAANPGVGELVITVNTWKTNLLSSFIVHVRTQLYQQADLVGGRQVRLMAQTWPAGQRLYEAQMTAVINIREMKREIKQEMDRQIGLFVQDYLTANPNLRGPWRTGTVRHMSFEGGFYGIVGDDGGRYDPHNLPQEFAVDGLRVRFRGKLTGRHTYHMWGETMRLIDIKRLD